MSPWWLALIIPGCLIIGAVIAWAATLLYIGSGLRF